MEQKPKKWPKKYGTRYQKVIILTKVEGEQLEALLPQYACKNISQLCKKIATQEITLILRNKTE